MSDMSHYHKSFFLLKAKPFIPCVTQSSLFACKIKYINQINKKMPNIIKVKS